MKQDKLGTWQSANTDYQSTIGAAPLRNTADNSLEFLCPGNFSRTNGHFPGISGFGNFNCQIPRPSRLCTNPAPKT